MTAIALGAAFGGASCDEAPPPRQHGPGDAHPKSGGALTWSDSNDDGIPDFKMDRALIDRLWPNALAALEWIDRYGDQDPNDAYVTTIGEERQINTFLRLDSRIDPIILCHPPLPQTQYHHDP